MADGFIRTAVVKTNAGSFMRPVTKLYPLEVYADNFTVDMSSDSNNSAVEPNLRVQREAAIKAMRAIKSNFRNESEN
jgi:hypothetical protein